MINTLKAAIETHALNKDNFMNLIFFISGAAEIKMEHFLDLPDELILKVLSYTETVDILRCGGVSKRIRTISNDNSLFQSVDLSGKIVKADFLETVLNKDCKRLNLSNSFIRGNLTLIQKSQLRKLALSNCQLISYDVLEELLEKCHSSFLDLPNKLILKVLSYTETADILRCGQVSKIIRTVSNDNSLFQTVNLSGKYVKTDLIEKALNKGCKSLNLSDSFIWGNYLNLIQKSQLRKLNLSNCQEIGCSVLEELFESCQYLKKSYRISLLKRN